MRERHRQRGRGERMGKRGERNKEREGEREREREGEGEEGRVLFVNLFGSASNVLGLGCRNSLVFD